MRKGFWIARLILLLPFVLLAACATTSSTAQLKAGDAAPDFSLTSATGEQVSLSDYNGQPVLLYFHMAVG